MLQLCATMLNVTWLASSKMSELLMAGNAEKEIAHYVERQELCGA